MNDLKKLTDTELEILGLKFIMTGDERLQFVTVEIQLRKQNEK